MLPVGVGIVFLHVPCLFSRKEFQVAVLGIFPNWIQIRLVYLHFTDDVASTSNDYKNTGAISG